MMIGIELVENRQTKANFDPSMLVGRKVCERAIEKGLWIRPLGDVIVLMPPLVGRSARARFLGRGGHRMCREETGQLAGVNRQHQFSGKEIEANESGKWY